MSRDPSYAVEHDPSFLRPLDVTTDGTESARARDGGFLVAEMHGILVCPHGDHRCRDGRPGAGYISAVILDMREPAELPLQRNKLCAARYALAADPGRNGTLIQIVDRRLAARNSPPVDINITVRGTPRLPGRLVDGWIKAAGAAVLEVCGNGVDDDGDGDPDCADRECFQAPGCVPEDCGNCRDDDGDGLPDFEDPDCPGARRCEPEVCDNHRDDDGDGMADCEDPDCLHELRCGPEICNNFQDDDGDGLTDCDDPSCTWTNWCTPRPEICDNAWDDDRDGTIDCDDTACAEAAVCPPRSEVRGGLLDEDRDGLVDCDDPDCAPADDCLPGPPRKRLFCDAADPANWSTWGGCRCIPDTLEVSFDGRAGSVYQLDGLENAVPIDTTIMTNTRSTPVQGWSFAVEHDASFLELIEATLDGTDADRLITCGFVAVHEDHIEVCSPEDGGCTSPQPGSGYISAVSLSFFQPVQLLLQRNSICRARYALRTDPGPDGTFIRIVHRRLKRSDSRSPVDICLTVSGSSKLPAWVVDGWVKAKGPATEGRTATEPARFLRGDADGNGRIDVSDPVALIGILFHARKPTFSCDAVLDVTDDGRIDVIDSLHLLKFTFLRGADIPAPFPDCGEDPTPEPRLLDCGESNCG